MNHHNQKRQVTLRLQKYEIYQVINLLNNSIILLEFEPTKKEVIKIAKEYGMTIINEDIEDNFNRGNYRIQKVNVYRK